MTSTAPAKLRIGCIHRFLYFPYWMTFAQGVNAGADEMGVELCLPQVDAEDEWQAAVIEVIHQRPHSVILPHNVVGVYPSMIQSFQAAGIPVIGAEVEPDAKFASVVHADEVQGTRLVVGRLFERIGRQGKIANIPGSNPTIRQSEFHAILREHPLVELAYEGAGLWSRETGAREMRAALDAHPDLRGVFAHNDHMALGAADVIAERGLSEQIVVVGFDADPEGLAAVREGRLAATVYRGLYGVGRMAVRLAVQVAQRQQVPPDVLMPTTLITAENLVDATLDTVYMLPGLLRDLVASSQAQHRLQQQTIDAQRTIIQELSTPIIPISDSILIMPLIGFIDSARAQQIMEAMLHAVGEHGAQYMIIDITGIAVVDTAIAQHLIQAARAIQLLGSQAILVGIGPEVAQALIGLGIDFGTIITRATLQAGFAYARRQLESPGRR